MPVVLWSGIQSANTIFLLSMLLAEIPSLFIF